jgi:hypothetical protein
MLLSQIMLMRTSPREPYYGVGKRLLSRERGNGGWTKRGRRISERFSIVSSLKPNWSRANSKGWMEATVQSVQDNQAVTKFQQDGDKVSRICSQQALADSGSVYSSLLLVNGQPEW